MLTPELSPRSVRAAAASRADGILRQSPAPIRLGPTVAPEVQARNEARLEEILERAERRETPLAPLSEGGTSSAGCRAALREPDATEIDAAAASFGCSEPERRILASDDWRNASRRTLRALRKEAPDLDAAGLQQAMRNAWVCLLFQDLAGVRLRGGRAVRAYSLLYPLTDNLLDDGDPSPSELADFLRRLSDRLERGRAVRPRGERERAIWRQLDRIDRQYPPRRFPQVRAALRAIHRAQVDALFQARHCGLPRRLLELSCAKGGASVLTDAVLVRGSVSPAEREFAFSWGVLLQLLDDFEDRHEDAAAGRRTFFTTEPPEDSLFRLWRLVEETSTLGPWLDRSGSRGYRLLLLRAARCLILAAVARQGDLDPDLAAWLESFSPVRFSWMRTQESRARERDLALRFESLLSAA